MPTSCSSAPPATTTSASRCFIPWSATIAGSIPPLASSRISRSAMLRTTWTWTQEWSDISSRCEVTCAMYHQARTRLSALTASRNFSSLRLPRVGAWTFASSTASAGGAAPARRGPRRRRPAWRCSISFALSASSRPWAGSSQQGETVRDQTVIGRLPPGPHRFGVVRRVRMSVCPHTGLAVPECSCGACIRAQLEEHMPVVRGRPASSRPRRPPRRSRLRLRSSRAA